MARLVQAQLCPFGLTKWFVFNSRFLAMAKLAQARLCPFGLAKTLGCRSNKWVEERSGRAARPSDQRFMRWFIRRVFVFLKVLGLIVYGRFPRLGIARISLGFAFGLTKTSLMLTKINKEFVCCNTYRKKKIIFYLFRSRVFGFDRKRNSSGAARAVAGNAEKRIMKSGLRAAGKNTGGEVSPRRPLCRRRSDGVIASARSADGPVRSTTCSRRSGAAACSAQRWS